MLTDYHKLEEEVFNILYRKHLQSDSFTFSARKKRNANAKYDYFIGTKISNYFAFTLWDIPVWYKGASIDLMDYIIVIKNKEPFFYFQYYMSKFGAGGQNKLNLKFLTSLKAAFSNFQLQEYHPQPRGEKFLLLSGATQGSENFLNALLSFIDNTAPKIDKAIESFKNEYPTWEAGRISQKKFIESMDTLKRRLGLKFTTNFDDLLNSQEDKEEEKIESNPDINKTEKEALVKSRLGQGRFRNDLISIWQGCAISKVSILPILRASHIKPWRISSNEERLDAYNGLLLLPNYDLLFEKFFISFKDSGKIIISPKITTEQKAILGLNDNISIEVKEENRKYLSYHREQFYANNQ